MLRLSTYLLSLLYQIFTLVGGARAALVNVTIDDAGIDPLTGHAIVYTPDNTWTQGNNCSFCSIKPDPGLMHNGTWRDVTYVPAIEGATGGGHPTGPLNLTFSFNGVAIYAFCALNRFTNMTFFIDDKQVNYFSKTSDEEFIYNFPVFVNTNLSPGDHVFKLMNGAVDGSGNESLVLFDYLIYSHEQADDQSPPPSPLPTSRSDSQPKSGLSSGAIGGIAAAVAVIALLSLCGIFLWWRRRRAESPKLTRSVEPFEASAQILSFNGVSSQSRIPEKRVFTANSHPPLSETGSTVPTAATATISDSAVVSTSDASPSPLVRSTQLLPGQVETDAGPLNIQSPNATDTLPPDYGQVLAANRHA